MENEELPPGWCASKLGAFCHKVTDGSHNPPKKQQTGLPMLSAVNIAGRQINFDQFRLITVADFEREDKRTAVEPGDVLVTIVGTIGRAAVVPNSCPKFTLQRSVAVLKPAEVDPRFLAYQIESAGPQSFMAENAKGTAQKGIYLGTLKEMPIRLAPLPEQQRIVERIETLFGELDKGEDALRKVQRLLTRYRQSVLKAAVIGELTAEWRSTNGPPEETSQSLLARILETRREARRGKYKEPVEHDTDNLPELPAGWAWASFEQLFQVGSDGGKKLPQNKYASQGRYPVIDQGEKFIGGFSDDESLTYEGDLPVILFGDHTRRFKLVREPFICGADGIKIICPPREVPTSYSLALLRSASFEDRGYSRHFQFVRRLVFPVAPPKEVAEILGRIEEAEANAAKIEELLKAELNRSTALRQSILKDAFSGRLVPQDPSDEPAEKMLERRRAAASHKMKPTRRKVAA